MENQVVSAQDFEEIRDWYKQNKESWPAPIADALGKVLDVYKKMAGTKRLQKDLLMQLRIAMGVVPKSEKGSTDQK